ncbi:hypothetical protein A2861_00770 [Candidatus Roizmanbacteria bacterium RIFCSPHIGHO2_01_FULL_38_15]|nr:MAG: hypothetical protein A2861_00770 [Candidatus Roizmanbacteria bacterium RIFCSPHIGHO2_01_FULL_38_15]OGK34436.1 MAG: hypothetical protein A3F59_03850 [Candidatus Roizmanbacteria bacterium RIFCSPHIGHO2_12_FULL_38_13]
MEDCIFCKIVKGEIPSFKVYEDQNYVAFMDIFPRVKGHALVIPKKHYRWVNDVPKFGEYWEVAKKISLGIQKYLNARFISYLTLGEEVHHAHIHILPQTENGIHGIKFSEVIKMEKEEIGQLAEEINKSI